MKMIEDYTPSVEIKDFNVLVNGRNYFDFPIKEKKHTERLLKWVKIMITQLVIYWIMNIFQIIINWLQ